jgi:N-acetyl-gamma-glutamyl-phosphate reductase
MTLAFASANEQRGERVRVAGVDTVFVAPEDAAVDQAALVFSALPHGTSAAWVERARGAGARVVDLSADLRPGSGASGVPYGLTELNRSEIEGADLVANPGCYPTVTLLALLPLLLHGLVAPGAPIVVNAASGVTGAGYTPRRDLLFAEVTEDFRPYAAGNTHRHVAEMRAVIRQCGADNDLLFTPHLLPVARGILATISVPLTAPLADPLSPWREQYAGEPFIEVTSEIPSLRDVVHRNVVRLTAVPAEHMRQPTLVVMAAIDNLMKGAAGQAVQNANVLFGLDETLGLPA